MGSPGHRTPQRCWECGKAADQPTTVTLRTAQRGVATLMLCARCYRTCYAPLAGLSKPEDDCLGGTLLIEPGRAHAAARLRAGKRRKRIA